MPLKELVPVDFGSDAMKDLEAFVWDQITSLKQEYSSLHQEKVAKWRRLYRGVPKSTIKDFPWKNASNVVIQLIGENVDVIRARILGTIFEVMPLWVVSLIGEWKPEEQGGEQQEAIQEALNYLGLEPTELDLYRVESQGADECVKFGTVMYKLPWITEVEAEAISIDDNGKVAAQEFTKYDGPRPEKLPFEQWAATSSANTLESADFKFHKIPLKKHHLQERLSKGVYKLSKEEEAKLLGNPDRAGLSPEEMKSAMDKGLQPQQAYRNAEWDVYECWFPHFHNGKKFRLVYSYHYATRTVLRAIYNFYPKNEEPWEMGRFGYTDDGLLGYGLCEMLEYYQEEVTTGHNQRVDNRTLANTSLMRVDPTSKLDAIMSLYPNAMIPAAKDEIEVFQLGANYPSSVEEERLTLALAKSRAGTDDPGMQASGGGTQNAKKGIYSAMGTFSVLQAGNRRTNLNITDMRYTHLKLGRKFLSQYANFGLGDRIKYFGERAELVQKALLNYKQGRLQLPIRAATASINKELEKQNDMLLTQVMQRHHMGVSQILQGAANQSIPDEMKQFLLGWIDSSSIIMARILRNFGHDDVSRLLPERRLLKGANGNGNSQHQAGSRPDGGSSQEDGGTPSIQPDNQTQGGRNTNMAVPVGGTDVSNVPI